MNTAERAAEVIEAWWIDHYRLRAMQRRLNHGEPYDHDTWEPDVGERAQAKANAEMQLQRLSEASVHLLSDAERAVLDAADAWYPLDAVQTYGNRPQYSAARAALRLAVRARRETQP